MVHSIPSHKDKNQYLIMETVLKCAPRTVGKTNTELREFSSEIIIMHPDNCARTHAQTYHRFIHIIIIITINDK